MACDILGQLICGLMYIERKLSLFWKLLKTRWTANFAEQSAQENRPRKCMPVVTLIFCCHIITLTDQLIVGSTGQQVLYSTCMSQTMLCFAKFTDLAQNES